MKAKLYRIHRVLSLVIFLPVVLWSLSGLLHPVMANWFRIRPAQKSYQPFVHLPDTNRLEPNEVCTINQLEEIENLGITYLDNQEVYQIKHNEVIDYYSTHTGKRIENGDQTFAEFLARYYVGDHTSEVRDIELISEYTGAYKVINRLLPVYKVSFEREDGMDVFVHTESQGLGTMNDTYRKAYLWSFSMFHNWNFLGNNPRLKSSVIFIFSLMVFLNGALGLFIYWKNRKSFRLQKKASPKLKPRKRHRKISLITAIFLLAFSFSGGYHSLHKFSPVILNDLEPNHRFETSEWNFSLVNYINSNGPISKISLAECEQMPYIRIKDTTGNSTETYLSLAEDKCLHNGNEKYAIENALRLSELSTDNISSTRLITHFEREYGFINKRLPVYEIAFNTEDDLTYYIEPSTGIPGAIHSNKDKWESFSFLFLHKYHFLDFMGKGWRDLIMSLSALTLILISITGLVIWLKIKRKKKVTLSDS